LCGTKREGECIGSKGVIRKVEEQKIPESNQIKQAEENHVIIPGL